MQIIHIMGIVSLLISLPLWLQAGWALVVSLDYRAGKTERTKAWLHKTDYKKRLNYHNKQGRHIRCRTTVWYAYTVDGRQYTIEQTVDNTKPHDYPRCVWVIYQRKRPGCAYVANWTIPDEPLECGAFAFLGLVFLVNGLMFLLYQ